MEFTPQVYAELVERFFDEQMTDGLPIVIPFRELVERAVAASGRAGDDVVGAIPPRGTVATVRDVATNAVMAGCRPEYMPVVLAAVEAMLDDKFNWLHLATSTKGCAPLIVVNGPIRHEIGINCRGNVFGPGHRANATIGRAVRLCMINLGGSASQVTDRSTFGHAGKFTYCIGEDEEDSPWEPYHVSRGYEAGQSTVFVQGCEAPRLVNCRTTDVAEQILTCIADMMCPLGSYNESGPTEVVVIMAKEHRDTVARAGYGRRQVQEFLFEKAARPAAQLRAVGSSFPPLAAAKDGERVRIMASPDHIHVFAAGAPAGRYSAVCFGFATVRLTASAVRAIA